jgi:zinc transport system substrate-binding protein
MKLPSRTIVLAAAGGLVLGGCSTDAPSTNPTSESQGLKVTAAFYPLEYIATNVGGDDVTVSTVTSPGVEPHDVELSPAAARELRESDVIIYVEGFQPAVDAAIEQFDDVTLINVEDYIKFREAEEHEDEEAEAHEDEEGDEHGDEDPHFWLDPALYAELAPVLAGVLAELDADNADRFNERAAALEADLLALDDEFTTALAQCERDVILVSHEAFGYLTDAYGLEQLGLAGLTPDAEPSPARLRDVREVAEHEGVTTIYFETLVDTSVSKAFASDLGLQTAVLDPLEGLTNDEDDYRSVMARNLDALVGGLDCA